MQPQGNRIWDWLQPGLRYSRSYVASRVPEARSYIADPWSDVSSANFLERGVCVACPRRGWKLNARPSWRVNRPQAKPFRNRLGSVRDEVTATWQGTYRLSKVLPSRLSHDQCIAGVSPIRSGFSRVAALFQDFWQLLHLL